MKILIIGRGIPSEEYPLNGIFEFDQAKALSGIGHEVIYLGLDLRSIRRKRRWGIVEYEENGVKIIEANIPCGQIPKELLIRIGKDTLKGILRKYVNIKSFDIVHVHFTDLAIIASKVIDSSGTCLVITEHSSEISEMKMNKKRYIAIERAYKKASKVLAVSSSFCRHIYREFDVKTECINNIVDTNAFLYNPIQRPTDKFVFVATARLIPGKRVDLLLDAFQQLIEKKKQVFLYIVGDGTEKDNLLKSIKDKNLDEYVHLCGGLERKDINNVYSKSHCFVLPSVSETFGVVYIEAMASGLPVIATKCGGPEDFVNQENGILIEVDNLCELVTAMESVMGNYYKYDGQKISEYVVERFSPQMIANQLVDVYNTLLK